MLQPRRRPFVSHKKGEARCKEIAACVGPLGTSLEQVRHPHLHWDWAHICTGTEPTSAPGSRVPLSATYNGVDNAQGAENPKTCNVEAAPSVCTFHGTPTGTLFNVEDSLVKLRAGTQRQQAPIAHRKCTSCHVALSRIQCNKQHTVGARSMRVCVCVCADSRGFWQAKVAGAGAQVRGQSCGRGS